MLYKGNRIIQLVSTDSLMLQTLFISCVCWCFLCSGIRWEISVETLSERYPSLWWTNQCTALQLLRTTAADTRLTSRSRYLYCLSVISRSVRSLSAGVTCSLSPSYKEAVKLCWLQWTAIKPFLWVIYQNSCSVVFGGSMVFLVPLL